MPPSVHTTAAYVAIIDAALIHCPPPPTHTHLQVSFLLEVYGQLEEPDGLSGLVLLRSGGLTLQEQVITAEKAGAWSEALALYQQALPAMGSDGCYGADSAAAGGAGGGRGGSEGDVIVIDDEDEPQAQGQCMEQQGGGGGGGGLGVAAQGQLRCLLNMGHLKSLLTQVSAFQLPHPAVTTGTRPHYKHSYRLELAYPRTLLHPKRLATQCCYQR